MNHNKLLLTNINSRTMENDQDHGNEGVAWCFGKHKPPQISCYSKGLWVIHTIILHSIGPSTIAPAR